MLGRKKKDRRVFAWISDTHAGKKTGLLNPDTVLIKVHDDGSEEEWQPEPSATQRWLWSVYEESIKELVKYVGNDELLIGHAGDVTHGDKYQGIIPETTREDQRIIAHDNLLPLLELPQVKSARFLTGTSVHVPEHPEARIAARLKETTGKDIACRHHARFDIGTDTVDASHHGPYPGSRDWLEGNVATYYLRDRVYKDRGIGKRPSVVYVRGHYHRYCHVTINKRWRGNEYTHHLIIVPAFSGLDGHTRNVAKSPPIIDAGIVALEFIDNQLNEIKPFVEELDLRVEERL